jgi:membrane-bound ClpP family serine protease
MHFFNLMREHYDKETFSRVLLYTVILIMILTIILFFGHRYIEEQREAAYLEGGRDAIAYILEEVEDEGSVLINGEGERIVLSEYHKAIDL